MGAAIWGLFQGRVLELLLWFIPVETTHFGVGFGRVEMSHWIKCHTFKEDSGSMEGWRGNHDLTSSAGRGRLLGSALKGSGKQNVDAAVCQRAQNWLFSDELPLFQQKKAEVPPPSTNPFLEDETGAETDEIVMEKSDTDKVSL